MCIIPTTSQRNPRAPIPRIPLHLLPQESLKGLERQDSRSSSSSRLQNSTGGTRRSRWAPAGPGGSLSEASRLRALPAHSNQPVPVPRLGHQTTVPQRLQQMWVVAQTQSHLSYGTLDTTQPLFNLQVTHLHSRENSAHQPESLSRVRIKGR